MTLSAGRKRTPAMTTDVTENFTTAVGLHAVVLTTRLTVALVPAAPTARSVYAVQVVTYALGNETVTLPAAVALPRAVCRGPALSVTVTRSPDLNPVPRIVNGFSFTTFNVARAVAVEAASVPAPSRLARSATATTALPEVPSERRLMGFYLTDLMYATIAFACPSGMFPIAVVMMPEE